MVPAIRTFSNVEINLAIFTGINVCQRRLGAAALGDCRVAAISSARSRIWASRASGSVSRSMAWQTISMPLPRTKWCAGSSLPLA